ncbi:MAG: type I toxin-antitoxin system SymE family toxin [Pantoea vagans]|nr:type I toxin-antitoxin system SymE family toxin [Pantoea vagans]
MCICIATFCTTKIYCIASVWQAHFYKEGCRPNKGKSNPLPQLTIKCRWLEALCFTTGQKIEVITGLGQLIIRLSAEG